MMAKVDFGKEADVGENKAISHAAIKRNINMLGYPNDFIIHRFSNSIKTEATNIKFQHHF